MGFIKFSIIIPVYKVEEYLERCVLSAISQTYKNIEVLLVDDGSPDKCPEMCDRYAQRDSRIKVIHKTNGGLSDARNEGLKYATGDYVVFLDSDDSIEDTACEQFLLEIKKHAFPDVLIGRTRRITENGETILNLYPDCRAFTGPDFLAYTFSRTPNFSFMAPNNVYRRCYLLEGGYFFIKGLLHEDERWTPIVLLNAKKVVNTDCLFYNYYIRGNSITTAKNKYRNALHLLDTVNYLSEQYSTIHNNELRERLMDYLVTLYLHAVYIGNMALEKVHIKREFVWKHALSKRNKIKAALFCISPSIYCWVNALTKNKAGNK